MIEKASRLQVSGLADRQERLNFAGQRAKIPKDYDQSNGIDQGD
jgi:hypothetical protein